MRNFHRDFESLNAAYTQSVRTKQKPHQVVHESVSHDMERLHREGSRKQLREAMKMLAAAHHKDHSSMTMEDCYAEMKAFAEENLVPQPGAIPAIPAQGPDSQLHNEPVHGLASEEKEFDHDGDNDEDEDDYKIHKDNMHKEDSHDKDDKKGKYDDGDDKDEKCDHVPCKEEKIEETDHSTLRAAQTDDENAEDDRKAAGLKKQGEIMKKDLEDEEKESGKKKVGENFEKMLELLKLSDQVQNESDDVVEEEMYDCIRDYMSDGYSRAEATAKCSGRGYEENSKTDEEDEDKEGIEEAMPGDVRDMSKVTGINQTLIKTAKSLAGGQGRGGMLGANPEKKIQKSYGDLMKSVAKKLTKATKDINKPAPPTPAPPTA